LSVYPETFGALKRSAFGVADRRELSVKDELRGNLLTRLATRKPIFNGVVGYEETVMPQIVNALLSRHNFILLGLRGQAKSRILRALTTLLDPALPIIAGSEVNDNPFAPISSTARTFSRKPATTLR
jgi:magnesium chelatase subunit I